MLSWLPPNVSSFGGQIDNLFYAIYYLTTAVFFAVQITLLVFIFRYRDRPGRKATYTHGNTTLEIVWTAIPAMILAVLALVSRSTWAEIKETQPPSDFQIELYGKQFNWEIVYPGPDGKLGTEDDVHMDNDFHVPVNKVVRVQLKSKDVIHSFFVPQFRLKQDAVPGRSIPVWFKATVAGKYEVPCAELCGFGHSGMRGWVYVDTPEQYEAWARQKGVGAAGTSGGSAS
jgi:cytochrome c oxidase subunit II